MGHEEHGGTWHMDAAQLDTQRKKGEAILKTSSTVYSTNRSSSSTRPAKLQLDRAEKSTVKPEKSEDRVQENADLGEPECYDFEEYEAPRMNPSVVAAHKRIGLLQRFNKWQGKAMEKMQKSMDKMVSKIKSLEKKVSGSSSKKKKSKTPTKEEGEDNSQRRRKSSKTRRSNSISELDRAEGRVDLEEPLFENLGSSTIQRSTRTSLRLSGLPTTASSKRSSSKAKVATHISTMKKRKKRSLKLDRVSRTQSSGVS
ncbi:unnamed protein product [Microthlaspi erraticum]|uniref:Arabidopsis retrotransposon Orf1 C-terminal domain-containing protein n=1 Tax=Microthlaspi erraticum TaxID=1685480 RepID=A0A6D2KGQ0_9BRAS|nr:unnamed protein product [Microthlaspi erraticum]